MRPALRAVLALAFSLLALPAASQTLSGRVLDAETGLGLPAATVALDGGGGTTTDAEGRFSLPIVLPATVEVRFLGYAPVRFTVAQGESLQRTVRLEPLEVELGEAVVTDENVGMRIMREVIRRKLLVRARLGGYQAEGYTRTTLRAEGRIVRLTERLSDVLYRAPRAGDRGGSREVVIARRRRPPGRAFRYLEPGGLPDFYLDDTIDLDGFRYTGPTHPDALDVYGFRVGEASVDAAGRRVIDIAVFPQRPFAEALAGRVRVVDSLFVLAEVELRPATFLGRPPPIRTWTAVYRQRFAPVGDGPDAPWLPTTFERSGSVDVGVVGARLPTVRFSQVGGVAAYRLGPVPAAADSLWARTRRLTEAPGPYAGREAFLPYRDRAPFDAEEAAAETSLADRSLGELLVPEGLLAGYISLPVEEDATPEDSAAALARVPLVARVLMAQRNYVNRVQNPHVGAGPRFRLGPRLYVEPEVGLVLQGDSAVGDEVPPGATLGARVELAATDALTLSVDARTGVEPRNPSARITRTLNALPFYAGWPDYFDYLHSTRATVSGRLQLGRLGVTLSGTRAEHRSVRSQTTDAGFLTGDAPRPNPPVDAGALTAGSLKLGVGPRWPVAGRPRGLSAEAELEAGRLDPLRGGDALGYVRLDATAAARIATFFRSRPAPQTLSLALRAGLAEGDVPVQRLGLVDGAAGPLGVFGGLRSSRLPLEGDRWLGAFWEYDFGRDLFRGFGARLPFGLAVHGGHAWTGLRAATLRRLPFTPSGSPEGGHHGIGAGLVEPFGLPFRFDLTTRLDAPGVYVTIGIVR